MTDTADTKDKASISDRLSNYYESCKQTYDAWITDKEDGRKKDTLVQNLHELRRVLAGIEIEIAKSESKSRVKEHSSHDNNYSSKSKKGNRRPSNRKKQDDQSGKTDDLPDFIKGDQKQDKKPSRSRSKKQD